MTELPRNPDPDAATHRVAAANLVEAADLLREAHAGGRVLRPCGKRSRARLTLARDDESWLSLTALDGIHWIDAADFTCEVGAGLSPARLDQTLAEHGLMLGVLAAGAKDGTLGGMFQAREPSLLAGSAGLPRDQVLGARWLLPDGSEVPSGARVVKSVAGYDVTRLLLGAAGRLAANTRLILRLRPRPKALRWFHLDPTFEAPLQAPPAWLDFGLPAPAGGKPAGAGQDGALRVGAWDRVNCPDPGAREIDPGEGDRLLELALQRAAGCRHWLAAPSRPQWDAHAGLQQEGVVLVDYLAHQSAWSGPPPACAGGALLPTAAEKRWLEPLQAALSASRNIQQAVTTASSTSPTKAPTQR